MKRFHSTNRKEQSKGQALVEYIIIVVIVAIAAIAIVGVFSESVQGLWGNASEELGGDKGNPTAIDLKDFND